MITEILGALIVLGAVLVLVMRHLLRKGKAKEKESVEVSASRLRYEIERSGDAVIGRMQIHVERLERLLAEANAEKAALDERLAALAQWEKAYGARLGALPQQMDLVSAPPAAAPFPPAAASPAAVAIPPAAASSAAVRQAAPPAASAAPADHGTGETASSFQAALMEQMAGGAVGGSIDLQLPPEEMGAAMSAAPHMAAMEENVRQEEHLREETVMSAAPSTQTAAEAAAEAYGYEEEYEEDEAEDEEYEDDELTDEEDALEEVFESEELIAAEEEAEEDEAESSSPDAFPNRQQEQVRAFLRQGLSVEEISQRLGLGLGAVELVRHMEKRAQEARDQAVQENE